MKNINEILHSMIDLSIDISFCNTISSNFIIKEVELDFVLLKHTLNKKEYLVPISKINYVIKR